jgi:tetratricopeptide (TPR) repeat protein
MKFYKYTPALLDPKTLEETLIGREWELDNLKRILKSASSGKSFSHAILIGPKGIGKTHLLRVLYYCIKGDIKTKALNTYKDKFVPIIFSEEEYPSNITKLIMLALRYLDESKLEGVPQIPGELMDAVSLTEKEKELAFSYIKTFKKKTGKIFLLLVDNLNDIMERLTEEDQSAFREILMTYESILLIGTAPTLFDSIINHDKPFYNFFEIIWLKDLSFEETIALLNRYAELEGREDRIKEFKVKEAKLRAIHELAGGNPRLILSLYHIIVEYDITSVEDTFIKLLDELSPYFRERLKDLSEQQKEIIDVIARAKSLLTPTEIAGRCYMPVNVVNSQIKRLEKIGYIKIIKKQAKKVFYDFNERLFSLWRQMRVEAGRKRLGFIVKFLEIWFTKEELFIYLDKTLDEIRGKLSIDYTKIQHDMDKLWYLKEAVPELKGRDEICVACKREDFDVALGIINKALTVNPDDVQMLDRLGCIYIKLKRYNDVIEISKRIIKIDPDNYSAWYDLGYAYKELNRFNEAIEVFKKAVEIDHDNDMAWTNLGISYSRLKKFDEAIETFKKAVEIEPSAERWHTWYEIGYAHLKLKRYAEAIEACKKSIETNPDENCSWYIMGIAHLKLKSFSDALLTFKKAVQIKHCKECVNRSWFMLCIIYLLLFIENGVKENIDLAIKNLKESINCLSHITIKDEIFNPYARAFKNIIEAKHIDVTKAALEEIKIANQTELLEFLSPFSNLIKYLETKDKEVIDRLRHEERIVVEDMLKMLEKKTHRNLKSSIVK